MAKTTRIALAVVLAAIAAVVVAYPTIRRAWRRASVADCYGPGHAVYTETVASRHALIWRGLTAQAKASRGGRLPRSLEPNLRAWIDGVEEPHRKLLRSPELSTARDAAQKAERLRAQGKPEREIAAEIDDDALVAALKATPAERAAAIRWHRVETIVRTAHLPEDVVAAHLDDVERAVASPAFDRVDYLLAAAKTGR